MPVVMALDPGCASAMICRMAADASADKREPAPGISRCSALIAVLKVCMTDIPRARLRMTSG